MCVKHRQPHQHQPSEASSAPATAQDVLSGAPPTLPTPDLLPPARRGRQGGGVVYQQSFGTMPVVPVVELCV